MDNGPQIRTYDAPDGIATNADLIIQVRSTQPDSRSDAWSNVPTYAVNVSSINTSPNVFVNHVMSIASLDMHGPTLIKAQYMAGPVESASIHPVSYSIPATVDRGNIITFTLDWPRDVMLQVNGSKWKAVHLLTNEIVHNAPTGDTDDVWYFGPGINKWNRLVQDQGLETWWFPLGRQFISPAGLFLQQESILYILRMLPSVVMALFTSPTVELSS